MSNFSAKLQSNAHLVEETLARLLNDRPLPGETVRPVELMKAMRHSALDGGKRLRPFLVIESAALFGVDPQDSVLAGAALELIHCYSLVHDDLPAMDDDELRRGKPTTHKAYGEATAILAGDALLTLAFDVLAEPHANLSSQTRIELVSLFARNAGIGGMVGGQMLDLEAEKQSQRTEEEILTMQAMKTGALIRCACEAGAVIGGANTGDRASLLKFGSLIGQAFQLADDILDETSNAEAMGKKTGKDADRGKATLVSLYGIEKARARADELLSEAVATLDNFGEKATILAEAAQFTVHRKN